MVARDLPADREEAVLVGDSGMECSEIHKEAKLRHVPTSPKYTLYINGAFEIGSDWFKVVVDSVTMINSPDCPGLLPILHDSEVECDIRRRSPIQESRRGAIMLHECPPVN